MSDTESKARSPNPDIDRALKKLMKKLEDDIPPDVAVKILAAAINWEKVKAGMAARDSEFDPDAL